jgi:hypothetical protein
MENDMEPKDLSKVWSMPDLTRLTPKQLSIRLPIQVAAQISAICDMYQHRTKTAIIGDLLAAALDQFKEGLSQEPTEEEQRRGFDPEYQYGGDRAWYDRLVSKYLEEMENEISGTRTNPTDENSKPEEEKK